VVSISGTGCDNRGSWDFLVVFLGPSAYIGSGGGGVGIALPVTSTERFYGKFRIPSTYYSGGDSNQPVPTTPGTNYGFATLANVCHVGFSVTSGSTG
jgi:hypothetical protein